MNGNNEGSTPEFDEFVASGEVEVGNANLTSQEGEQPKKAAPRRGPPKSAEKPEMTTPADDDDHPDGVDDDEPDGEEDNDADDKSDGDEDKDGDNKPKKSARDHQIERLKREKAELARQLREASNTELARRLENLEKGLQDGNSGGNSNLGTPEPDPMDTEKYPLGHLDDRYIEDKLEWLAEKKAAERADAVLQRQQENEQNAAVQRQQQELLEKVDDLATRGSDIYEDFQESVVESGMRGDWDLSQATFEAAHEADNGAQILYELSQDKKEATRVARLSPYQQMKFVQERDAEIGKGKTPRRIPRAGEPPKNTARGANSRTQINPATDNLDDFEKAWEADAKRGHR